VKRILRATLFTIAILAILSLLFHVQILTALGSYLIKAGSPQKADIVVVLAGDGYGRRILKGGELIKDGWAPRALISGPNGNYGHYECDLAIPFAVKAGYPESDFIHLEHRARSTEQEAQVVTAKLREMGVKKVLLVTSDYHTHRAGRIFRRAAPDLEFIVVASQDEYFAADRWWHDREARKIFLFEWMKTIAER
jgi:uncharacterized SAM-binding protein YcdF (DUF218 family)